MNTEAQQEWTKDRVELAFSNHGAKGLAKIITAALTAERQRADDDATDLLVSETKRLSEAVADERQRREQVEQELTVVRHRADTAEEAEVAERQRREKAEEYLRDATEKNLKLNNELLSALAAIEKHNKETEDDDRLGHLRYQTKIEVDLSQLHEHDEEIRAEVWAGHDAETRKPLVDFLTEFRNYFEDRHPRKKQIDDALAKGNTASICCPICAHITAYPADAQVVKCGHCQRSFQLEPTKKETPDGDNNKRTETH